MSIESRLWNLKSEIADFCVKKEIERIPTLIAVSKTKPESAIAEAYAAGQRDFGENYAQELKRKAASLETECPEIRWHFIGNIQKKQINYILNAKNLVSVQTIG